MRQLVILGAVVFLITAAAVTWQALRMDARHRNGRSLTEPVDVAIVLGSAIDPDGQLRFASRRRVITGVRLLKTGMARRLIMSGDGHERLPTSVADLMRTHAIALGADPDAVLVEEHSDTTLENLALALPMARAEGATRIAIVTDQYHLTRVAWLAWAMGETGLELVAAPGLEYTRRVDRIYEIGREALAWWWNLGRIAALLVRR